jgi:hypothetical protein
MLDANKILNALLCKDLNQEKGFTLFLIWYDFLNSKLGEKGLP